MGWTPTTMVKPAIASAETREGSANAVEARGFIERIRFVKVEEPEMLGPGSFMPTGVSGNAYCRKPSSFREDLFSAVRE